MAGTLPVGATGCASYVSKKLCGPRYEMAEPPNPPFHPTPLRGRKIGAILKFGFKQITLPI